MKRFKILLLMIMAWLVYTGCDESGVNDLPQIEPELVDFKVTNPPAEGEVDREAGTVLLKVPVYADITKLIPDVHLSYGSTITPASGTEVDFSSPVTFTISNGGLSKSYTVTVEAGALDTQSARIAILGTADNLASITNADEKAAAQWTINTFKLAKYVSFNTLKANPSVLDDIDAIWWHYDTSYELPEGNFALPSVAMEAEIVTTLINFRNNGGGLYLSGFATQYLKTLEVVAAEGNPDEQGGAVADFENADNWGISFKGQKNHPVFEGLRTKDDDEEVAFLISGGAWRKDNKSWWVVINEDFPYGVDLASTEWDVNHDILVLLAEFPGSESQGKVIGFSAGAYDWYSAQGENTYMDNVKKITENILLYVATPK
jgi:hypothetical protein